MCRMAVESKKRLKRRKNLNINKFANILDEMATHNLTFNGYYLSADNLPEETGIYLVYTCVNNSSNDKVTLKRLLYIGKSLKTKNTNLRKEVKQHVENGKFDSYIKSGEQLCFSYAIYDGRSLDVVENGLILMQSGLINKNLLYSFNHPYSLPVTFDIKGKCSLLDKTTFKIIKNALTGEVQVL